jgi:hypothetical protein
LVEPESTPSSLKKEVLVGLAALAVVAEGEIAVSLPVAESTVTVAPSARLKLSPGALTFKTPLEEWMDTALPTFLISNFAVPLLAGAIEYLSNLAVMPLMVLMLALPAVSSRAPPLNTI